MRKTDREAAKARLETLCARRAALGPEDEGERLNLQEEIFELVFDLFPKCGDEITSIFLHDWKKLDLTKGSAYGFFSARIHWRGTDAYQRQKTYEDRTVSDAAQADEEGDKSRLRELPAGPGSDPGEGIELDDSAFALLSGILELRQRLRGRANNPTRRNYFRLFFTDNMVTYLHGTPASAELLRRERELFTAVKEEFLDFFMQNRCRTIADICRSPLKPHGALVEGRDMEETKLPLPGDVYVSYLDREEHTKVLPSAVSQQKQMYLREVRKWLL